MKIDDTNDYLQLATRERVHSICLTLERSPVKLDGKFLAGIHAPKAPSTGFQAEGLELEVRRGGAKRRLNEPTPSGKQANSRRCAKTARSAVFKCRPMVVGRQGARAARLVLLEMKIETIKICAFWPMFSSIWICI